MIHKTFVGSGWLKLDLVTQLANVGSEFSRYNSLKSLGDIENAEKASDRLLELLDLTIADQRWSTKRGELLRLREVVCCIMYDTHDYEVSSQTINNYFLDFALLARS